MPWAEGERPLRASSRPRAGNGSQRSSCQIAKPSPAFRAEGLGFLSPAQRAGLRSVRASSEPHRGAITDLAAKPDADRLIRYRIYGGKYLGERMQGAPPAVAVDEHQVRACPSRQGL